MDKKIKDYLKKTEFHLKDYAKTEMAHKSYNEKWFNELMKDHKERINEHFEDLRYVVVCKVKERQNWFKPDLTKISHIAMLKTDINHVTRAENIELMTEILYGNVISDALKSRFAIKFYLKYYKRINKIMKEALIEIVTDGL